MNSYLGEIAYVVVAVVLICGTLAEGYFARADWNARRFLGLAACLVWPLLFIVFAVMVARMRHERKRDLKPVAARSFG